MPSSMATEVVREDECHTPPPLVRDSDTDITPASPKSGTTPTIEETSRPSAPSASTSDSGASITLPLRPRVTPPYMHGSRRSASSVSPSPTSAPVMTRAYSSPVVSSSGRVLFSGTGAASGRPSSPLSSYRRYHSPSRRAKDEAGLSGVGETVWEESETGQTPERTDTDRRQGSSALPAYHSHTFPRRHRPSSPLHQTLSPNTFVPTRPTSSSGAAATAPGHASPVSLAKYNEAYPSHHQLNTSISSTSSVPSTPTSTRSRSPSVSSLETIPDSPDAEEAALEAERIAQLKAAADAADGASATTAASPMARRRSYLDVSHAGSRGGHLLPTGPGFGSLYGSRDKRKRWSVCGAERRGDLDLETIWED